MRAPTLVALLCLSGCSLGNPTRDDCQTSAQCRSVFGGGFYCDTETGLCESAITPTCPELFPAEAANDPEAIVIGTIFDRTSPNQLAREKAARLAVSALDERSGIDGRLVALLHCDTSVAPATDAADHLIRAGVPAIVGPSSSSNVEAVFASHRDDGVLVISPSATATQLGGIDPGTPGLLWRTAPPDNLQADVIIQELVDAGATTVGIVTRQNDTYGQSLSVLVQMRAAPAGITIGATPQFADVPAIAGAASAVVEGTRPDGVLFISSQVADAAAFLDAAAGNATYDGLPIFLPDAAANEDLFTRTTSGSARFGQVRATRPSAPDTIITNEFVSNYMAANGGENPLSFSFTAHAYDATALVLLGAGYALGDSDELTGQGIAEGINRMSGTGTPRALLGSNFLSIIEELRSAPDPIDVVGASGPLDYGPDEELTSAIYDVLDIDTAGPSFRVVRTRAAP
ncbi:MAG: ABC transporter substrate-binding protein [Sandaracinaceae bacterium]|nr:ABC transporter substrate-binding protein [Sandaracinaceae bacterium]